MLCIEMVPDEIQQEMKNIYCALCELLRHFWACFPTTTKALEDKVLFVVLCTDNLLSVQCYAWTENKFTCVCVCVCVSVTLSVNPPTDQTPQQIFTVDGFMQGCAFWGSR